MNNYYAWLTEDLWSNFDANIIIMCSLTQYQDGFSIHTTRLITCSSSKFNFRGDLLCWCILYMYCTFDRVEILLICWDIILQSAQKNTSTQTITTSFPGFSPTRPLERERERDPGKRWSRGSRTKLFLREESFVSHFFVWFICDVVIATAR